MFCWLIFYEWMKLKKSAAHFHRKCFTLVALCVYLCIWSRLALAHKIKRMRLHVAISLFYKCKADDEECMHTNERKSDENSFFTFQMLDNFIISRSDNILTIVAFKNAFFSWNIFPENMHKLCWDLTSQCASWMTNSRMIVENKFPFAARELLILVDDKKFIYGRSAFWFSMLTNSRLQRLHLHLYCNAKITMKRDIE